MSFKYSIHQIVEDSNNGRVGVLINSLFTITICRYYYSKYRRMWVINYHSTIQFEELYFRNQKDLLDYVSFKIKVFIIELKEDIAK